MDKEKEHCDCVDCICGDPDCPGLTALKEWEG